MRYPYRSISFHLGGAALSLVGMSVVWAGSGPGWLGGLAIGLAAYGLGRAWGLHQARHRRLNAMLEAVARATPAGSRGRVLEETEDEVGQVAVAINRLLRQIHSENAAILAERELDIALVRETPNGLLVTDAQGVVRRANPALLSLLPVRGDPVGRRPIDSIPVADFQEVIDDAQRLGRPCERTLTHGQRDLIIRAMPKADGAGCLGVVLDITTMRRAERARSDFVANVSHEIRTPITAIIGYTEALSDERTRFPDDLGFMLDAIRRNAARLQLLIDDVLQLARLESRSSDLELREEPIAPVLAVIAERFEAIARAKGLELVIVVGDEVATINPEGLEHAVSNLVDNAIKYTERGRVEARVAGRKLTVSDTGPGIGARHLPRIFERFYRVDDARARLVGGTGLGLAIVKHLCQAMRAEVHVESEPGVGSRFTLTLPR